MDFIRDHLLTLIMFSPLVSAVIISLLDQTWQTGSLVTIDGGLSVA